MIKLTAVAFVTLLFGQGVLAQQNFTLTNASAYFDIKVSVAKCEDTSCSGKTSFAFSKKGSATPYQVISLPDTYVELGEDGKPNVNVILLYDKQSVVNIGDYNFDGMEDVALCNGLNGSYGGPSYSIYLSSRTAKKFVFDRKFSALGVHLGMFEVDNKKKVLRTFDKSGCCFHVTEEFDVVNNAPRKIFAEEEDATIEDETKVKVELVSKVVEVEK
jgi:hypothetical protein